MSILILTGMLQSVVVYIHQYFSFLFCCAAKFEVTLSPLLLIVYVFPSCR